MLRPENNPGTNVNREISLRQSAIPSFSEWCSNLTFQLDPSSPRSLQQLYEDIFVLGEVQLIEESGVIKRYGKGVYIDVFYDSDRALYKLREERFKLLPGRSFEDFLVQPTLVATRSHQRPQPHSLGERVQLELEQPQIAAIRALKEELFGLVGRDEFSILEHTLTSALEQISVNPTRIERAADFFGNSYRGIPSILDMYIFKITFRAEMLVPIRITDSKPQPLYEYIADKGYVNVFTWDEI